MGQRARFVIEELFDLASRGGILAAGELQAGAVEGGMRLRAGSTGSIVRVIGVELACPGAHPTLIIDRRDAGALEPGVALVGPE